LTATKRNKNKTGIKTKGTKLHEMQVGEHLMRSGLTVHTAKHNTEHGTHNSGLKAPFLNPKNPRPQSSHPTATLSSSPLCVISPIQSMVPTAKKPNTVHCTHRKRQIWSIIPPTKAKTEHGANIESSKTLNLL
jgi:hypothetical protein